MIIGIPRERKTLEKRIALTPDGATELTKQGHTVLIEKNAGAGSFFDDGAYIAAGCRIVETLKEVWAAEMVVKVKEPHESEYEFFRPGLVLFDYLHLAGLPEVAKALVKGGVLGIAYELVQTEDKRLPLLEPMSEIAGKLSVINGAHCLLSQNGGRGVLIGGAVGVPAAKVIIVGAGIAGTAACEMAVGMGALVTILDISKDALEKICVRFGNNVRTVASTEASLMREAEKADLLIGAVLVPGAAAPTIITRQMVQAMKQGSVIVDISIDQGGCVETIRTTSLQEPTYVEHGVIHYGVPNMPAQTPRTSTIALTNATLPYILKIANNGADKAIISYPEIGKAVNTKEGKITNRAVAEALRLEFTPLA